MNVVPSHRLQAVILTKNEEPNIGRTLEQLQWLERIVIVDSFSTDATQTIIESYPNTVLFTRAFDTHATQWNFGLDQTNSQWILSLDADYILPPSFSEEVKEKIQETDIAGFDANFRFLIFDKPLRGNNTTPRPVLFQKSLCRYFDDGHTQRLEINGSVGTFHHTIDHDDRKSLSRWIVNQSNYSLRESQMLLNTPDNELSFVSKLRKTKLFAPFFLFFYCLFVKGLIFDGWRGWYYTLQRTVVEMLFALQLIEQSYRKDSNKSS